VPAEQTSPTARRTPPTREHLANERTMLAWIRTGVTLIALGFGTARFGAFVDSQSNAAHRAGAAAVLGIALGAAGVMTVAMSVVRFLRARAQIAAGRFRAELWPEALLAAVAAVLGVGVAIYLLLNG
jgi:putative membrane protein